MHFEMAGTGKPLLLLHSGVADHRMWAGQCGEFSRHFQVIMPDFRGYGKSPAPEEPFHHYEDIHALVRHLGFASVNIAGCSLGGKAALEMAIAYPRMVDRMVLIAPGMPDYEYRDEETLAKDAMLEGLISSGKREEVADMLVDIWVVGLKPSIWSNSLVATNGPLTDGIPEAGRLRRQPVAVLGSGRVRADDG